MFRDFPGKKVPGVLDYQGVVFDQYRSEALNERNVLLQMPTGSGKGLIGLLIAEWRRRKFGERCVYLCPTNQLAKQVADQAAAKYGISSVVQFRGRVRDYAAAIKAQYELGHAIAITSYSALFNSNPYFSDANFIILDDCHVSDQYVAKLWTVELSPSDTADAFERTAEFLRRHISPKAYRSLIEPPLTAFASAWVDMAPIIRLGNELTNLRSLLSEALANTDQQYSWSMVAEHLEACQIYLGSQRIAIRPITVPTQTFTPLHNATQRLYMSATPGLGGNFERMTGIVNPYVLQTPPQLSSQAVGRRYFIFPGQSLDESDQKHFVRQALTATERSVIIVPSKKQADKITTELKTLGKTIFTIEELEDDKSAFVLNNNACAVLAGRYDGLDFPDRDATLLIIDGLRLNASLQDLFLKTKSRIGSMLDDRERTRIIQAVGRCTRSETDRSAVIIRDDTLVRWFRIRETQGLLPIEIQAEVEFGLIQSSDASSGEMLERFTDFSDNTAEWNDAESEIRRLRTSKAMTLTEGSESLAAAATYEVEFVYAIWEGRYQDAIRKGKDVIDQLSLEVLTGYRGFWELQTATAAWLATEARQGDFSDQKRHMLTRASKDLVSVQWLPSLAGTTTESSGLQERLISELMERLASNIQQLGLSTNVKFDREISEIREGLADNEAKPFENALVRLGKLLGFDAGKIEEEGTPDPWWSAPPGLCFIFEAHSNSSSGKIGSGKSRQAALQGKYIREKLALEDETRIISVLISDSRPASEASSIYLKGVSLWNLSDFRTWAERAVTSIIDIRNAYSISNDFNWRLNVAETYRANGLDPLSLEIALNKLSWSTSQR